MPSDSGAVGMPTLFVVPTGTTTLPNREAVLAPLVTGAGAVVWSHRKVRFLNLDRSK